ncbi:LamG domain-containing protein [Coprococcus eutactus]|uniref:LamG domain-containing protein n=1 Tax=Coprococcus eutactus TaxID=33043 RepID=UPI00156F333D|nr:LamG domain-containing protein [Coprococcus eutactus]MCB5503298.1 LamG domain-containing protein [Coprococcus eutactus]NSC95122.1 LamG domain-containing protein [Coprococcus eutactus]NSD34194.1 LamG domain-containing protein [Coprococcus eutactus]
MLCLWLPFTDGVIKNQGLINDEFITSIDPTFSNDGKLGKCLEQGQFDMSATMTSKILNNQALTICFWIYINAEEGSQGGTIFGNTNSNVEFNNRKFSIFQYPTCNDLHLSWMNDAAKAFMMTPIYKGVLPSYQWTHVTVTYHNPTMTVYINGIKKYTYSGVSNSSSFEYQTRVVWQNAYRKLNDFRIYNECLSPRQVKEISKGLVCHYPLGEIDGKIGGRNLLVKTNQGKTKWTNAHADGSYSCESVNWNGINVVKMSCATPTTSWKMFTFNGLLENFDKLEPSAIYTLSYDVIGNIKVGFSNLWDSDATHSIVALAQETVIKKTYGSHYIVNITLKDALNKSKQLVYFRNDLKAGESVIIANLKLEKGNKATAYTPCPTDDPVMYDNVIYDTSGYCNNGNVSGDILWDINTPRYKGAYDFNGTGYIYNDNLNLTTTAFTISFWIKIPSAITHQHFDFATFNSWTSEGVGIYWDTSGQKSSSGGIFGKDSNGDKIHVRVQCRGKLNEWTHFAITWDGTNVYRYSNGIKFSESDFNAVSVYHPRLWLGNSTFGDRTLENSESCMSDFRFYVTALSDSDILELYQSSASVDNNGNLMLAGEVIEE